MNTPILFIIFNRPKQTSQVFEAIRRARPSSLYIAADGPHENLPDERELCEQTRSIVKDVDWPCEVKTLFQEKNLGILHGPHTAISWFFENVDQGIILEDDCLPDQSFFRFCEELLEYYRDDERVMMISGDNFQDGLKRGDGSYYFSKISHIWGWATWRRAWHMNDISMSTFPRFKSDNRIKDIWANKMVQRGWIRTLERAYHKKINSWDFQWLFAIWSNSGLCILPNQNLVSNIGFGGDAIHTKSANKTIANLKTYPIGEIKHPTFVLQDKEADEYTYRKIYRTNIFKKIVNMLIPKI